MNKKLILTTVLCLIVLGILGGFYLLKDVSFPLTITIQQAGEETMVGNNCCLDECDFVTFWFDGYVSTYEEAFPLMRENEWPGVVAALADREAAINKFAEYQDETMSWEQVDELVAYGWEISSHSMTHPFLNNATAIELKTEIVMSQATLEELGYAVNSFTYPYNQNGGNSGQELIAENYSYWRSTATGINPIPAWRHVMSYSLESTTSIEEVESWLDNNHCGWLVINIHSIQDNPDNDWAVTPEFFAEVIAAVESDGAQVVIPDWIYQAYGYAEER